MSLVNRINQTLIRRNGQLVEEAPTPTSQLAGQAGLQAPPTSPAAVGVLGGTSKQQDMAGSGAQKQSALRQSLDTSNTLQEATADKRYRSAMTAEEQAQAEKQKRLGEVFGSTQQKVQDLINAHLNVQSSAATPTLQAPTSLTAQSNLANTMLGNTVVSANPQDDVNQMWGTLSGYLSNGKPATDPLVVAAVNRLSALTGQTPKQISQSAADAAQSQIQSGTGAAAAEAIADPGTANVTALLPSLGTNRDELAQLLGVDPSVVDTLSIDQLNNLVSGVAAQGQELSTAETESASQSGLLGAAERAALRERSKELSTSGAAANEAQLEDLGRSLESADTVAFGGRNWTVEELLSDDNISKLVSDYLTNPESESSKQLAADPNSAGLIQFASRYADTLRDAATAVGSAAVAGEAVGAANKQLTNVTPSLSVPDSVMAALYGDTWKQPQGAQLAPKGLVQAISEMTPAERTALEGPMSGMFGLASTDPAFAKQISQMNKGTLATFLGSKDANGATPFDRMQANRIAHETVERNRNDVDALVRLYFQGVDGTAGITQALEDAQKRQMIGVPYPPDLKALDKDLDGKLDADAADSLYARLSASTEMGSNPLNAMAGLGLKPHAAPQPLTDAEQMRYTMKLKEINLPDAYSANGATLAGAGTGGSMKPIPQKKSAPPPKREHQDEVTKYLGDVVRKAGGSSNTATQAAQKLLLKMSKGTATQQEIDEVFNASYFPKGGK